MVVLASAEAGVWSVERIVRLHIERLPEGVYLATSDDVQGLVAQGRTISETVEIARDVARRLIEAQQGRSGGPELPEPGDAFEYPMLVAV
jgi:predicted RNase H-like HicB family nuclease